MSNSSSSVLLNFIQLSEPLKESLSTTPYSPPEPYANVSIKSHLQSLLPDPTISEPDIRTKIKDFALCCASLASAANSSSQHLSWVPNSLSSCAVAAFRKFSEAYNDDYMHTKCTMKVGELELDLSGIVESDKKLMMELMPQVLPLLNSKIKETAIDASDENDGVSAASARAPVAYAILAAHQLRWFVVQVDVPYIGKLCPLVIPCALTVLDHWSPEVKSQGMISLIYLAKNVNAAEIGGYADVILDACCQNIASDDEIWHYVVEMSVRLVTLTQKTNPRSSWYEKLLAEMLNHLERQPRNKKRRIAWLTHCEPLLNGLGLLLLAHFRRLFPLFFKWMHADDDETVLLYLITYELSSYTMSDEEDVNNFSSPSCDDLDEGNDFHSNMSIHEKSDELCEGMSFDDVEDAQACYKAYAIRKGFSIRKNHTRLSRLEKELIGVDYTCSKEGFRKEKTSKDKQKVKVSYAETRVGCKAMMSLRKYGVKWNVSKFVENHNHVLCSPRSSRLLPGNKRFTPAQRCLVDTLNEAGVPPRKIMSVLSEQCGGQSNIGCTPSNIQTYLGSKRRQLLKEGDAQRMYNYFNDLKNGFVSFHKQGNIK
ncbi:hypothetical protein OROHE_007397 [Orobanche hederae]